MAKQLFILSHDVARQRAVEAVKNAPAGFRVSVDEPLRSLDANAAMWPILQAFSEQLQWPVNGRMEWMTPEEWKDVLTAAFEREHVRLAMAFDGPGVVMLGKRTSKYGKRKFSDLLEFLHAAAVSKGVVVYPKEQAA